MSEWIRVAQPVRCKVELDKQLTFRRERGVLAQGDANANAIIAEVYLTDGLPYDLTGCTALLTFVRPDNLALPPIEAEISGNTATATLTDACYEVTGTYAATMQLRKGGDERTVLWLIGDVKGKDIDGIVDPDHEIISIEDLMATAAEAQKAANAANAAAARANAGAERAEQLQIDASGLAGDSNKLGDKPPEYYLPAVQLLNNPALSIAQAGYNGYHGTKKYAADRWFFSNNNGVITKNNDSFIISGANAMQKLPANLFVSGQSYTAAIELANGEMHCGSGVYDSTNAEGRFGVYGYIWVNWGGADDVYTYIQLRDTPIKHVGIYPGTYTAETLPPFVPRPYAVELAGCQWYCRFIKAGNSVGFADGFSLAENEVSFVLHVNMRTDSNLIVPTAEYYHVWARTFNSWLEVTGVKNVGIADGAISITFSVNGAVAGQHYNLYFTSDEGFLMLNSDL